MMPSELQEREMDGTAMGRLDPISQLLQAQARGIGTMPPMKIMQMDRVSAVGGGVMYNGTPNTTIQTVFNIEKGDLHYQDAKSTANSRIGGLLAQPHDVFSDILTGNLESKETLVNYGHGWRSNSTSNQFSRMPADNTLKGYILDLEKKQVTIHSIYQQLLQQNQKWLGRLGPEPHHRLKIYRIDEDIMINRDSFESITSQLLIVLYSSGNKGDVEDPLLGTKCRKLRHAMGDIQHILQGVLDRLDGIYEEFEASKDPQHPSAEQNNALRPDRVFGDMLDAVPLRAYQTLAEDLVVTDYGETEATSLPPDKVWELTKLSTEGRAAAKFYQCLCRACPVNLHEKTGHTAHLSLKPGNADAPAHTVRQMMTQCDMAIKRTVGVEDSLWLKLESYIACSTIVEPSSLGTGNEDACMVPCLLEPPAPELDESDSHDTRKRRASSSFSGDSEPPSKIAKTRQGQNKRRLTNSSMDTQLTLTNNNSDTQVCPEYLAQLDRGDLVVMKMKTTECRHQINYLPPDKRPHGSITLPEMLRKIDKETYKYKCNISWRIYVSRLIAEAVLRFDWRDSKRRLVFYEYELPGSKIEVDPFLEVIIGSISATDAVHSIFDDRRKALLNLGLILLQLGNLYVESDSVYDLSPDDQRKWILDRCSAFDTKISGYAPIVRHCATFFDNEEENDMTEEEFEGRYYELIVHPLRQLEKKLKEATQRK